MPPPTREEVNALIERLTASSSILGWEARNALTALQAENDRLRAQASPAWVALSERNPTQEDGDRCGRVLQLLDNETTCFAGWNDLSSCTHWMRLPAPPESAADRQRREDEQALEAAWVSNGVGGDTGRYANFCKGFRIALAHARKEATP